MHKFSKLYTEVNDTKKILNELCKVKSEGKEDYTYLIPSMIASLSTVDADSIVKLYMDLKNGITCPEHPNMLYVCSTSWFK